MYHKTSDFSIIIKKIFAIYLPQAKRNSIKDVGVTKVYGIDTPMDYQTEKLTFVKEHIMIPKKYINELKGFEKFVFSKLYAGSLSKKLYRLLEYQKKP